jgi:hypothetical protein
MSDKGQKLSGMEMMLNSLMRAAGFNPNELAGQMTVVIKQVLGGLDHVVKSLEELKEEQKRQGLEIAAIRRDLHILKCAGGINDPAPVALLANGHAEEQGP